MTLDLGCGRNKHAGAFGVDGNPDTDADVVADINIGSLPFRDDSFDCVLLVHVIEHVDNFRAFMTALVSLTRPGGALILATINRTLRSYLQAILGAEYVLRWLPEGTHDWRRFLRPAELGRYLRGAGAELHDITGMHYLPRMGEWQFTRNTKVNYLAYAVRP